MSDVFELKIDSIAAGGDGVGRRDGMVVFVPRTAPGDFARVSAVQEGRLMRGRLLGLHTASASRVEPACAHYTVDRCGGCQVQHLSYEAQIDAKAGIIRDSMTRIGRTPIAAPIVEPSGNPWRYRGKLTLAMRRGDTGWIAGLHRYDAPHEVFALRDCPITDESVLRAWAAVLGQQASLPDASELRAAVRLLATGYSLMIEGASAWPASADFFAALPDLMELWWQPDGLARRLLHSRGDAGHAGASFTQVNPGVAAKLTAWVLSLAETRPAQTAVDAYAGTGDFAVALASRGARVTAIEIDRDAARVCASRLPAGSHAIATAVESALPAALPADLVILNPPRAGLTSRVTDLLESAAPKPHAVIYVSCNPATLARDVRRMGSYRVQSVRGFDMFPQTAHVETVCELVPAA